MLKKQFLSLAIRYAGKSLVMCLFFILLAGNVFAASTYDWVGTVSSDWATPQNWRKGGFTQTATGTYPSQATNDVVKIGVNNNFTLSPVLSTTLARSIASLEFGDNNGVAMSLTINTGFTLTVSGDVTQDDNAVAGGITTNITGAGTLACQGDFDLGNATGPASGATGANSTTINSDINALTITGTLVLTDARSGTTRFNNPVFNLTGGTLSVNDIETDDDNFRTGNTCTFKMCIGTVANTLILLGTSPFANLNATVNNIDLVSGGTVSQSTVNYAKTSTTQNVYTSSDGLNATPTVYPNLVFSGNSGKTVRAGTLSVGGDWTTSIATVNLTANDPVINVTGDWNNSTNITMGAGTVTITGDLNNTSNTITGNTAAATLTVNGALNNSSTIAVGAENMTFALASTNSVTYTGGTGTSKFTAGLTNTGTVTESTGTFTIGSLANNTPGHFNGSTTTGTTNITGASTNSGTITVNKENINYAGTFTNTGTYTGGTGNTTTGVSTFSSSFTCNPGGAFNLGTSDVKFNGDYTNTGTGAFTPNTTGNIIFGGAAQNLVDNSTSGTSLTNVQIQGTGTKTMSGTKGFFIPSNGELTMGGSATLDCGGVLTLQSDATGSAIVDALPAGTAITGNAKVERFIRGNAANKRGYRLMTSTVFTGSPGGIKVFDLDYLKNNFWISGSGGAANGFNVTTTQNPSIYLFREDVAPPPNATVAFTTGYNWKGVAKINNSPLYNIGTQAKTTTTNINDFTTTIPVGNGILVFDRGDNSSTAGKTVAPFTAPGDVTVTQVGQLNTGNINVISWYTGTANFTFTTANTGVTTLIRGFTFVGNPYPATINWEKYNNTAITPAKPILGTVGLTIYELNPTNKTYETYIASNSTLTGERATSAAHFTGSATNYIASGMGFFVVATAANQTLSFTENAKVTTNGMATILNTLMGKPKETAEQPEAYIRLKLVTDSTNTDEIVIAFDNKKSSKFVQDEDAIDLGGNGALQNLSSFSTDSIPLAINVTPFPGKQPLSIPLFADATASGSYQLNASDLNYFPKIYSLWLKDAFTADSVELKLNTSYSFTIDKNNAATFGNKRFTVVVRQDSTLAYKLLDFSAEKTNRRTDVQLVWKTQNEENYTRFTVERSTDRGQTFNVIGGMTSTGAGTYSLIDKRPCSGQNIYRLKQEDLNDAITYSSPVQVRFDNGNSAWDKLSIYPNPAYHSINLAITARTPENAFYSIRFVNSSGVVIKQVTSSEPEWHGNISNLRPGTYLVKVINNRTQNIVGENKFVKL